MCSRRECQRHIGQYVRFRTPHGLHEGVIEKISGNEAIVLSPRQFIPVQLASESVDDDEVRRLDIALAWGGYGGGAGGARGPYGYGGYGGYGAYGWGRWAVSFLIIYVLWGLLLW